MQKYPRSRDRWCVRQGIGWCPTRDRNLDCIVTFPCSFHENEQDTSRRRHAGRRIGPPESQVPGQGRDLPDAPDGGVARAGRTGAERQGVGSESAGQGAVQSPGFTIAATHSMYKGFPCGPRGAGFLLCSPVPVRAPAWLPLTVDGRPCRHASNSRKQSVAVRLCQEDSRCATWGTD